MNTNHSSVLDLAVAMCAIVGLSVIIIALLTLGWQIGGWLIGVTRCAP